MTRPRISVFIAHSVDGYIATDDDGQRGLAFVHSPEGELALARGEAARSRHNLVYWRGEDYVGVGPGAHGRLTVKGERHATLAASRPGDYSSRVAETGTGLISDQTLNPIEAAEERLLLGLRIEAGVTYEEVAALGLGPDHAEVRHLVDLGLLVADPLRLRASPAGRLVLNALTERLALAI